MHGNTYTCIPDYAYTWLWRFSHGAMCFCIRLKIVYNDVSNLISYDTGIITISLCLPVTSHSSGKNPGFHYLSVIKFSACSIQWLITVVSVLLATNPCGKNLQSSLFRFGTFCLWPADSIHFHSELRSDTFVLILRVAFSTKIPSFLISWLCCGMWDFRSLTRNWTHLSCIGNVEY